MRGWVLIVLGASCTGRPLVEVDDGETSGAVDPEEDGGEVGVFTVSQSGSATVDDDGKDDDGGPSTTSGAEPECEEPSAPPIAANVYPGEDPLDARGGT